MQTTKTLIVDDNAAFRREVRDLLASEPDIEVVGEAVDGEEAIRLARTLKPDLVLMDVRMPGTNGISATAEIRSMLPQVKVIILTIFDLEEYREAAIASGASGYVVKNSLIEELVPAIRGVC